ncbi:MAG: hypothetical protein AAGA55_10495, partial [Planctomycetota bacterium]
ALVGVGAASWSLLATGGGETVPQAAEREVLSTLDSEGNEAEALYRRTRGGDAGAVVGELAGAALEAAKSVGGFGTQGPGAAAALGESVELAIGSLVSGDVGGFAAAMAALGATIEGEIDAQNPVFRRLADKLEGAEVDVSRLEVSAHTPRRAGARVVAERQGDNEQGDAGRRNYNENVMAMRPASWFGNAGAGMDERALDVRFPFLARGSDREEWFGMVLVWSDDAAMWQPGEFQLIRRTLTVEQP